MKLLQLKGHTSRVTAAIWLAVEFNRDIMPINNLTFASETEQRLSKYESGLFWSGKISSIKGQ